jgi:hypothetical protein
LRVENRAIPGPEIGTWGTHNRTRSSGEKPGAQLSANSLLAGLILWADYCAAFHDKTYVLEGGDVVEGVAGDGDDVGQVAGLELAYLAFSGEQPCAFNHVGLEDGERLHAVADHQLHLDDLGAVREWADVRADGEGDAGGDVLLAHEAHGFVAELGGMVDGGNAGLRGCWAGERGGAQTSAEAASSGGRRRKRMPV